MTIATSFAESLAKPAVLFSILCALAPAAPAYAATAGAMRQEVAHLLDSVAASHCQFNRNGSWYEAAEARDHLRKKFDYLDQRHQVATAENFIERAATSSSISGKSYLIRCPGAAPVESAAWLGAELARYRKQAR